MIITTAGVTDPLPDIEDLPDDPEHPGWKLMPAGGRFTVKGQDWAFDGAVMVRAVARGVEVCGPPDGTVPSFIVPVSVGTSGSFSIGCSVTSGDNPEKNLEIKL